MVLVSFLRSHTNNPSFNVSWSWLDVVSHFGLLWVVSSQMDAPNDSEEVVAWWWRWCRFQCWCPRRYSPFCALMLRVYLFLVDGDYHAMMPTRNIDSGKTEETLRKGLEMIRADITYIWRISSGLWIRIILILEVVIRHICVVIGLVTRRWTNNSRLIDS